VSNGDKKTQGNKIRHKYVGKMNIHPNELIRALCVEPSDQSSLIMDMKPYTTKCALKARQVLQILQPHGAPVRFAYSTDSYASFYKIICTYMTVYAMCFVSLCTDLNLGVISCAMSSTVNNIRVQGAGELVNSQLVK
jgi:hypothetical protein